MSLPFFIYLQAEVERLYFISPKNLTKKALSILKAAGVDAV